MGSLSLTRILFLICSILAHLMLTTASQPDFLFTKCSNIGNYYTNDNPFKKNLDIVLFSISSISNTQVDDYGFYNASSGEEGDPDRANAKALCRKGVNLEQCRSCVNDSVSRIIQKCPNQKEATGWYDDCQIVYSNNSVHGDMNSAADWIYYGITAPDVNGFNEGVRGLLDRLRKEAASGTSIRKSASGDVKLATPNTYTVYGLVDCFPDMSDIDCDGCLRQLQNTLSTCCSGRLGARLFKTSCQLNYDINPLYKSLLSPLPPSPPPQPDFLFSKCSNIGNYTNNNPFKKNLDIVLSSISSISNTQVDDYGFYNASSGEEGLDRTNAKALCRKGVNLKQCRSCVNDSVNMIIQKCPNQKEATGWYNDCQILYSNNSVHGDMNSAADWIYYGITAPDANGFNEGVRGLLDRLRKEAASGTSIRKSASGNVKLTTPNTYIVYGLVDCFPDMSNIDCDGCLRQLQNTLSTCCSGRLGARLFKTSCQLNYDIVPLYQSLFSPPPPSSVAQIRKCTKRPK